MAGGTYSNCSDPNQPGVTSLLNYLSSLPRKVDPNCAPGRYYLLNNYNPGYFGDGMNAYANITNKNNTVFTIPPSNVRNIGDSLLKCNPELWKDTAIFVTFDEGGGYHDSGYVQPVDFFGDGTRIPLIVVSPYTKPGHISHDYSDHVSILKLGTFIPPEFSSLRTPRCAGGTSAER
jgi:Phosphoesterase family